MRGGVAALPKLLWYFLFLLDWYNSVGIEDAVSKHGSLVYSAGVSHGNDGVSLVTAGGRVVTVVATASNVATAAKNAQLAVQAVNFTGKTYRTDIALKALRPRFVFFRY